MLLMGMIVEIIVVVMVAKGYDDGDDAGALDRVGVTYVDGYYRDPADDY